MKIQSAGRLGNQLYIFSHALDLKINFDVGPIVIFADRFHSKINHDLLETFGYLSGRGIDLKVSHFHGFLLKFLDKLSGNAPQVSGTIRRALRIETEGLEKLSERAWIQRGYFQNDDIPENVMTKMNEILLDILENVTSYSFLKQKIPVLANDYQAIHIRRTDFFSTEGGVIDPNSQRACVQHGLKVVICTDATKGDIESTFDCEGIEIITPKEASSWETLAILSNAENLVMTNSTLSFWAGFIASKKGKTVWAPRVWNKKTQDSRTLPFAHYTYSPRFEGL